MPWTHDFASQVYTRFAFIAIDKMSLSGLQKSVAVQREAYPDLGVESEGIPKNTHFYVCFIPEKAYGVTVVSIVQLSISTFKIAGFSDHR